MDGGYLRCQHRLDLVPRLDAFDDRQHKAATPRALLYWNRRCANGVFFWVLGCHWLTLVNDSEMRRMVPLFALDQTGVRLFLPMTAPDVRRALAPSNCAAAAAGFGLRSSDTTLALSERVAAGPDAGVEIARVGPGLA